MLGRLFKQNSLDVAGLPSGAVAAQNSYEDSYTREILYGSPSLAQIRGQPFNPRRFRLVVAQDGGNLRNKQVLYDSAHENATDMSQTPSPAASPTLNTEPELVHKISIGLLLRLTGALFSKSQKHHNLNDLHDYMFGRGLPSSETHTATKVHYLPPFSLGYRAVLVTKLFLFSDKSGLCEMESVHDPSWAPTPAFPLKETSLNALLPFKSPTPGLSPEPTPNKSSVSSRFSIGVVIPLEAPEQNIEGVVLNNWEVITHYLVVLQKVVTKKLIQTLKYSTVNNICPYITNRRILFPNFILQTDHDLDNQLHKLVKLVHFNSNTPRLINSHSLIKHSIEHPTSKFKPLLINWALEVVNWLEFKDGRNFVSMHPAGANHLGSFNYNSQFHNGGGSGLSKAIESSALSNTFLASLLALLVPFRHLLTVKPMSPNENILDNSKEVTRVVIMTGNSMVAKKLIFILNAIIPDYEFYSQIDESYLQAGIDDDYFELNDEATEIEIAPASKTRDSIPEASVRSNSDLTDLGSMSPLSVGSPAKSTVVKPIPIRNSHGSQTPSECSSSISNSSHKGWEVPVKSVASVSFIGNSKPTPVETTENIPIVQHIPIHGRNSISNSSSMAYLSSSLTSSLSSSASNYSLSKFGSSFLEKWKNSLVSGSYQSGHHNGHSLDEPTPPDLTRKPSILSLKTPSPAIEHDEYAWETSISGLSLSPARHKISRTQSLLDLYNPQSKQGPKHGQAQNIRNEMANVSLKRTKTSVIVPIASDKTKGLRELNTQRIHQRCSAIMSAKVVLGEKLGLTLMVDPIDFQTIETGSAKSVKSDLLSLKLLDAPIPLHKRKALLPNVAFVEEFRPEYVVQSCPVNPKLESQVTTAMKNDLLFFQNNCAYDRVTSRTIFISLRAREIKMIEMQLGEKIQNFSAPSPAFASQVTPPIGSNSPNSWYFHGAENSPLGDRRAPAGNTSYRTTIKKVFTPNRNSGDKELINRVEAQLDELTKVVAKINNDGEATSTEAKEQYNRMLFDSVREILQ